MVLFLEKIWSLFVEKWPYLALAITAIAIIAWLTIKLYKYHLAILKTKETSVESKDRIDNLKCQTHEGNYNAVKKTLESVKNSLETLKDMNANISAWIMKFDNNMIDVFAKKQSPIMLTKMGKELLEMSFAKNTVDNNLDFFIKELEVLDLKTPFDIEEKALDIVLKNTGNEMFNDIKNFIYYSPEEIKFSNNEKAKISLQAIIKVMSIYIRDKYFEKYPEIQVNEEWQRDIDKLRSEDGK